MIERNVEKSVNLSFEEISVANTNLDPESRTAKAHFRRHEIFYGGLTLTCAQIVDNEVRTLGFIHNIDYLMNSEDPTFFRHRVGYEQYESFNATTSTLPFIDTTTNIKIDISWKKWSCCSACCCSVALCGLYANTKKCHEVDSYRTRKGLLSFMLLDFNKPLKLPNDEVSRELDRILRLSPYREEGIAIFSSMIHRTLRFQEHLWSDVLKPIVMNNLESWLGTTGSSLTTLGLFIEEESCVGMEQMKNCSLLAACRGQTIVEPPPLVEEPVVVDPCAETPMVTLSVLESKASFRFEPNTSYRLRLDGLDMEGLKSVKWKIGERTVGNYDSSKPCHEQGITVHENGFDLILIEPNETQVVGVVIEAFTGRHRFRIQFMVDSVEDRFAYDYRVSLEKAAIAAAAIVLLMVSTTLIHHFKWRTQPPRMKDPSRRRSEKLSEARQTESKKNRPLPTK
nr:Hypothetical protein CBG08756 [Haemonchus contortus]